MKQRNYKCNFCGKGFVNERRFLNHKCKEMARDEEFRTLRGQTAWDYYKKWMQVQRKLVTKADSFLHSRYYKSFIRFVDFTKKVKLPSIDTFIEIMVEYDISPTIWTSDAVYDKYLSVIDTLTNPLDNVQVSINTLLKIADAAECDVSEVFDCITPSEVIQMVRERRLSPWILLNSTKFKTFLISKTTTEQRAIFEGIMSPSHWKVQFTSRPKTLQQVKKYVSAMGL